MYDDTIAAICLNCHKGIEISYADLRELRKSTNPDWIVCGSLNPLEAFNKTEKCCKHPNYCWSHVNPVDRAAYGLIPVAEPAKANS